MKNYRMARISDGLVLEIIETRKNENDEIVPIEKCFTPQFIADLVDVSAVKPAPMQGWLVATDGDGKLKFSENTL